MRTRLARLISFVAILLCGVLLAPVAADATPRHAPTPRPGWTVTGPTRQHYAPEEDPAGDPCAFGIRVTFPVNKVVAYTYKNAQGRVVAIYYTGALVEKVIRVDTGRSVVVDVSGDGVLIPRRNGSSILYGFGPFSSTQHPGDRPGPEFAVLHGISALRIAADGTKTILYSTRVTNLCDRLA